MVSKDWLVLKELVRDARRDKSLLPIVYGFYEDNDLKEKPLLKWKGKFEDWLRFGPGLMKRHPIRSVHVTDKKPIRLDGSDYRWGPRSHLYGHYRWDVRAIKVTSCERHELPDRIIRALRVENTTFDTCEKAYRWLSGRLLEWAEIVIAG